MTSSDWGNGFPTELMVSVVDIFKKNLDGNSYACFSQISKHWKVVCKPTKKKNMKLIDVSDFQVLSATKMFTGVNIVCIVVSPSNTGIVFKHIAGLTDVTYLIVYKNILDSYDLRYISTIYNLQALNFKVVNFCHYGIMSLKRHQNLTNITLTSPYCEFKVNVFSKSGMLLKYTHMFSINPIMFSGFYD